MKFRPEKPISVSAGGKRACRRRLRRSFGNVGRMRSYEHPSCAFVRPVFVAFIPGARLHLGLERCPRVCFRDAVGKDNVGGEEGKRHLCLQCR